MSSQSFIASGDKRDLPANGSVKLFTNGSIYIDAGRKVRNLLVQDGVVVDFDVDATKYGNEEVVDLKGAAAYPGFVDSHAHLMEVGVFISFGAHLNGCDDAYSMSHVLAEKAKTIPESKMMLGAGFLLRDYDKWSLADLAVIDEATGNRPVFLADKLGHNAIINTAAIKLIGITPATKVPFGGKIGLENEKLTGMLRESAMNIASEMMFSILDSQNMKAGALMMLKRWASIGYTGIVDLMGATGIRIMRPELFIEMEKEGTLPLRINYCYTIFNLDDVDKAAMYKSEKFNTDLVRFLGCKIFVDGAFGGGYAWTSWANLQGNHGVQEIYTDDIGGEELNLNRIVAKVEEYGMNMHYHTQGDMAISAVLHALDKVIAQKGRLLGIHTLIHVAFPTEDQIEKIRQYNGHVVVTTQPAFWPVHEGTAYYYGERAAQRYPIKKLIAGGLSVGISTDFSVSPPEYSPASAVIGIGATGGGNPRTHIPVSVKEMINGLTVGSNATTGRQDVGKLDKGYKADIVVYEKDLYSVPPEKFTQDYPKVVGTYVGGIKVF